MTLTRKRSTAAAAIVLAAGLGLAGCTGGPDNGAGGDSGVGQQVSSEPMTAETFSDRITEAQLRAGSAHLSMVNSAGGQEVTVEADMLLDEDPSKMSMLMISEMPGIGDMEIRLVEGAMYINMGEMSQGKFISASDMPGAEDFGSLTEQIDPQQQMEMFSEALQDFAVEEDVEEIDGVTTDKYTLTLETAKVLEGQDLSGVPTDSLPETITYEMFVGPDDLPRRIVTSMMDVPTTMDFSQWGEPVSVEAPGADEIIDPAEMGMPQQQ